MPGWKPVELVKLCCNKFVKQIYNEDERMFLFELKRYGLPEDIHNMIFELLLGGLILFIHLK